MQEENKDLILASGSPRRLELLQKIGINPVKVIVPDIDESVFSKEKPYQYVKRMAFQKAQSVAKNHFNQYILAADTIVIKGARYLGKPKNREEAYETIKLLSGSRHKVLSAFCIISPLNKISLKTCKTSVSIKRLTEQEINWYLDTNEWQGKSGAYGIQGVFEVFVKQINGSVSSVVGLPLMQVYNVLQGLGYKIAKDNETK